MRRSDIASVTEADVGSSRYQKWTLTRLMALPHAFDHERTIYRFATISRRSKRRSKQSSLDYILLGRPNLWPTCPASQASIEMNSRSSFDLPSNDINSAGHSP
jgi:hypothetical protein